MSGGDGGPRVLEVVSPWTQEVVVTVRHDSASDVDAKLARARRAFATWRERPLAERSREVARGLERLGTERVAIARELALQVGKPVAQGRREVDTMLARAARSLLDAPAALAAEPVEAEPGLDLRIEHEPLGVVLAVAAWNYPLLIPINVVVPALLAGNVVLLKHSARTPLAGRRFADAFGTLDPPDLVQDLVLDHGAVEGLAADPRIDHVAFTGSVAGGRALHAAAGARFIDVGLELGGKDPAYVAADADLDFAAENIVDGALYNAGQSCCAVERVYVHRDVHDAFVARALAAMATWRMGDPLDEATTLGPLASRGALDVLERQVDDAVARGARLLTGGRRMAGERAYRFPPTLLVDVPQDALVMQEESFGPLLPVRAVADDAEAIRLMDDSRFGLTASVWTRSRELAERVARALEVGTVFQNRCDFVHPALPWSGARDSGRGASLSRHGFRQLTRTKSLHFRAAG